VQGSLIASLLFLCWNARNARQWLHHPGHWILLLNALPVPVILIVHTVWSVQLNQYGEEIEDWLVFAYPSLIYCAVYLGVSALWAYAVWRLRMEMPVVWTVAFGLFFVIAVFTAFEHAMNAAGRTSPVYGVIFGLQFLVLLALFVASIRDAITGTQRDWLHWFAVAITFVAFLGNPAIEWMNEFYHTM
jgi:hypothetical protein